MAWVRIDDDFFSHPKVLRAWWTQPAAIGLWPLGLAWSARTDGEVSAEFVQGLIANRRQRDRTTDALVDAALWEPNGNGGWQIHDWGDYNPTRAEADARRRADRERKRTGIR